MKTHKSRKGGSSSKKSSDRLERALLEQDFADRVNATDRINKIRRERRNQQQVIPSAPPAASVPVAGANGRVCDDENVDPNRQAEEGAVGEECTYADLSKEDLGRARGDFQQWEYNTKKGVPQQPPQKPPKKSQKPTPVKKPAAKPQPVEESPYTTGAETAAAASPEIATDTSAANNDVGDESRDVIYADIVGVLKS